MSIRRVTRAVVGSVLIAIGGLWTLFFAVLLLWIWGEPNVGGYVFLSGNDRVGHGVRRLRVGALPSGIRLSVGGPAPARHSDSVAKSVVGVALIALGSLWALLTLIAFVVYDGDPTVVTYAYFLGSAALGFAVAFLGGLLGRRASSGSRTEP